MSSEPHEPQPPTPPRRPFQDAPAPEPFHRSPEFLRLIWFSCLLAFVGLFVVYLLQSTPRTTRAPIAADATAGAVPSELTPEALEARRTKLRTLFEGALSDTQNSQEFRESQGYWRLLQILTSYTPEEVAQRATRRLDYAAALRDPDAWRGEFVTVRGVMAFMYADKLHSKVFGIEDVYRGFLTDADGENGLVFDLPNPPPAFEMRRSPIDIEGIFYRTALYETESVRGWPAFQVHSMPLVVVVLPTWIRVVPYILARNMRVVENPQVGPTGFLQDHGGTLLILMGLAIFMARLLMYVFQRRARRRAPARLDRHADFHAMFEAKLREERRASGPRPPA